MNKIKLIIEVDKALYTATKKMLADGEALMPLSLTAIANGIPYSESDDEEE